LAKQPPDQRHLVAAFGYLFTPVVPIVVLSGNMKRDRFLRQHAWQALLWAIPFVVLLAAFIVAAIMLLRLDPLTVCLLPFLFLLPFVPGAIWARRIYLTGEVRIPVLTPLALKMFSSES
jgi:uncharacterized membrane protein